ncbi:MAG: hypothetical protein CMM25_05000, partial [Rhodospirillaceae bacterium]|nr:hypothetical protein [Rhodospirillaceae bacterium]
NPYGGMPGSGGGGSFGGSGTPTYRPAHHINPFDSADVSGFLYWEIEPDLGSRQPCTENWSSIFNQHVSSFEFNVGCWKEASTTNPFSIGASSFSFNTFSSPCVPWAGIYGAKDESGTLQDWWFTDPATGNKVSWEIPSQAGQSPPKGINPSYARRFKATWQTFTIHDHFQVIQFPWPKGAKDEVEASDRIQCYLNALQGSLCINVSSVPQNNRPGSLRDTIANAPSEGSPENAVINDSTQWQHFWLNGSLNTNHPFSENFVDQPYDAVDPLKLIATSNEADTKIVTSDIAERYLGYRAEPHWVIFDSSCVGTEDSLAGFNHSQGYKESTFGSDAQKQDGCYSACVAYNYPACPLRLDQKQLNLHTISDQYRNPLNGSDVKYDYTDTPEKRRKEGYGPGGAGPLAPMALGFSDCETGDGGSVWGVSLSSCSGHHIGFMGGGSNSFSGAGSSPSTCRTAAGAYDLDDGLQNNGGIDVGPPTPPCIAQGGCKGGWYFSDEAPSSIGPLGRSRLKQLCYIGAEEFENWQIVTPEQCVALFFSVGANADYGVLTIPNNVLRHHETHGNVGSHCACDCNDCLYPSTRNGNEVIKGSFATRYDVTSCCVRMGEDGWPGPPQYGQGAQHVIPGDSTSNGFDANPDDYLAERDFGFLNPAGKFIGLDNSTLFRDRRSPLLFQHGTWIYDDVYSARNHNLLDYYDSENSNTFVNQELYTSSNPVSLREGDVFDIFDNPYSDDERREHGRNGFRLPDTVAWGPQLVGWLCGFNSHAFNQSKEIYGCSDGSCNKQTQKWTGTINYCFDPSTCPALFANPNGGGFNTTMFPGFGEPRRQSGSIVEQFGSCHEPRLEFAGFSRTNAGGGENPTLYELLETMTGYNGSISDPTLAPNSAKIHTLGLCSGAFAATRDFHEVYDYMARGWYENEGGIRNAKAFDFSLQERFGLSGIQAPLDCEECSMGYWNEDPTSEAVQNDDLYAAPGKGPLDIFSAGLSRRWDTWDSNRTPWVASLGPVPNYEFYTPGCGHTARNLRGVPSNKLSCNTNNASILQTEPYATNPNPDPSMPESPTTNYKGYSTCQTALPFPSADLTAYTNWVRPEFERNQTANHNSDPRMPGRCGIHHEMGNAVSQYIFNMPRIFRDEIKWPRADYRMDPYNLKQEFPFPTTKVDLVGNQITGTLAKTALYWPNSYFLWQDYNNDKCADVDPTDPTLGCCCYWDPGIGGWGSVECQTDQECSSLHASGAPAPYTHNVGLECSSITCPPVAGLLGGGDSGGGERSGSGSERSATRKPQRRTSKNNIIGSCCYKNSNGKQIARNDITSERCDELNGIHSARNAKTRIKNREIGCCDTCNSIPSSDRNKIKKYNQSKQFRSRVDDSILVSIDTNESVDASRLKCYECEHKNVYQQEACLDAVKMISIYEKESNRLCSRYQTVTGDVEKQYYNCRCQSSSEFVNNLKITFKNNRCNKDTASSISDTLLSTKLNQLLQTYKVTQETCQQIAPQEIVNEDVILGGCCYYIKSGSVETQNFADKTREYKEGQLRKCSYIDKLSCQLEKEYDTVFERCITEDCSSNFRNTELPETCVSCNRNYNGSLIKNPDDLPKDFPGNSTGEPTQVPSSAGTSDSSGSSSTTGQSQSTSSSTPPPSSPPSSGGGGGGYGGY